MSEITPAPEKRKRQPRPGPTVVIGAIYDRRTRGRIHPAWYWGAFAILFPLLIMPLAMTPAVVGWAAAYGPPP